MTFTRYECASCHANSPIGPVDLCHACSERFAKGEIDGAGNEILLVNLEELSKGRWKVTWPRHPYTIAHGLMGTEFENLPIEVISEVTMPGGDYIVEFVVKT